MLGSFPLFLTPIIRYAAVILFFFGIIIYVNGLIENADYQKAKKESPPPPE
jgi:hypothetical protein